VPNFEWTPCPPPQPGDYLTRRDLDFTEDRHKLRKIRAWIVPGHFDGQSWNLPAQPDYYREIPGKRKA
jgi:hypothetical protein